MRIFFYDKTFDGLLSAIFDAYTQREFPDALLSFDELAPLHAASTHRVTSDADKAARVFRGLRGRLSRFALTHLLYAGLALSDKGTGGAKDQGGGSGGRKDRADRDTGAGAGSAGDAVFRYIRKVFDAQRSVEGDLADPDVAQVARLARAVSHERHRLLGFARFQKSTQGVYVAALAPRYDLLPLLVPHFRDRFRDQPWILYDAGRGYGLYWDRRECREISMNADAVAQGRLRDELAAKDEKLLQELWKTYCSAAVIHERLNPKLQARCMPRRYWKYLVEKQ